MPNLAGCAWPHPHRVLWVSLVGAGLVVAAVVAWARWGPTIEYALGISDPCSEDQLPRTRNRHPQFAMVERLESERLEEEVSAYTLLSTRAWCREGPMQRGKYTASEQASLKAEAQARSSVLKLAACRAVTGTTAPAPGDP